MSIYRLFNYNEVQGHFTTNEVTHQKLHNTVNMCNKVVNGKLAGVFFEQNGTCLYRTQLQ